MIEIKNEHQYSSLVSILRLLTDLKVDGSKELLSSTIEDNVANWEMCDNCGEFGYDCSFYGSQYRVCISQVKLGGRDEY